MTLPILAILLAITITIPEGTILSTSITKAIVFAETTAPPPSLVISSLNSRDFRIHPFLDLHGGGTVIDNDDNNGRDDNPSSVFTSFLSFTVVISSTRVQINMQ